MNSLCVLSTPRQWLLLLLPLFVICIDRQSCFCRAFLLLHPSQHQLQPIAGRRPNRYCFVSSSNAKAKYDPLSKQARGRAMVMEGDDHDVENNITNENDNKGKDSNDGVDDDSEDDDEEAKADKDYDSEGDVDIKDYVNVDLRVAVGKEYQEQAERATRQLVAFQTVVLRERLRMAKQRLQDFETIELQQFQATSSDNAASMPDDIQDETKKGYAKADLEARIDNADGLIGSQAPPIEIVKRQLLLSSEDDPQENVLSVADIEAAIDESHECETIKRALDEGYVKPFFHTLLLPEEFLNNRRSFDKVTAGEVDETRTLKFDEVCRNLHEVIDTTKGKGARSIYDKLLKDTWDFSPLQTDFAIELVNTDATMLGHDIECTDLSFIPMKFGPGLDMPLLTRPESRGVVAETFHRFTKNEKEGSVSAITGSPGIGKSWTLFYALQQALHYDGANVLLFFQKSSYAVMYLRRNHKIYAWRSTSSIARSDLFMRSDVLVLLDPKEAKQGGADFSSGNMKLIYAASNNEKHFSDASQKDYGKIQAFLGPPSDNELFVILKRLKTLPPDVIRERKKKVGNLIRYILDDEKYENREKDIRIAVQDCANDARALRKALDSNGMSGETTIQGTLFQVMPRRPPADSPLSIGYDGQNVSYREVVVEVANNDVRQAILKAGRN